MRKITLAIVIAVAVIGAPGVAGATGAPNASPPSAVNRIVNATDDPAPALSGVPTLWQMVFDVDPALAARTRAALARELEGSEVPVAAAHFPGLRFGRLLAGSGRRGWTFE